MLKPGRPRHNATINLSISVLQLTIGLRKEGCQACPVIFACSAATGSLPACHLLLATMDP